MIALMNRVFCNWPIRAKIAAVVAVPAISLAFGLLLSLTQTWQANVQASEVATVAGAMDELGQAVHELQKERAASVVFVGAKGNKFGSELLAQREAGDKTFQALRTSLALLERTQLAASVRALRPGLDDALAGILADRSRIDKNDITAAGAAASYTSAIRQIVAILSATVGIADNAGINSAARAYVHILNGKEWAGQERAAGAAFLSSVRFVPTTLRTFVGLGVLQQEAFAEFTRVTTPGLRGALADVLASSESREVDRMREIVLSSALGEQISAVQATDWYAVATARIDQLKIIESKASHHLEATAIAAVASASNILTRDITVGCLALVLSLASAVVIAGGMTKPIGDISKAMLAVSKGEIAQPNVDVNRKDEIGAMATALTAFCTDLAKMREMEEKERASSARRLRQAESMALVVADVGTVVAAAAAGDFSARLQIDEADEQMQKLVSGINEINGAVDMATREFAQALSAVAGGDLTIRVDTAYYGRFADLKNAINDTVERLSSTVKTIQTTTNDVGLAAREINMGADDLSKRTEEQASSLEETAATTEELAASVKASAQASKDAAAIADEAMQAAQSGGVIAGQAVEAMARIESASQKIADIIRVIDDIAFQTNLLALNAAVEAARAGDAGKGFAVVASEVRTLAQRSSAAAKDISGLISSSNMEVGEGVKLVREAGSQLDRILAASQKVAATITDISAAAGEQANGIDEMSQAVAHLDEMTQANAALAEQSAASAASLTGRTGNLNELVAMFRTRQVAPPAVAVAVAQRAPATEIRPAHKQDAVARIHLARG